MSPIRQIGWGLAALLLVSGALVASMVRIVEPSAPSAAARTAPSPEAAKADAVAQQIVAGPQLILPVQGVKRESIHDSWGDARGGGTRGHTGTDIMAPGGTPVVAAAAGTVEKLFFSNGGGGITAYVRSPDRLWTYYYAHLGGYAPGVHEGQLLNAGGPIGYVGDTGNAGAGNYHLHFGISRMRPEERWHQGVPIDPYPLLAASRRGG
jgi:murein DD-endopeptidase MepM/ murein hydrolase activator NlpD